MKIVDDIKTELINYGFDIIRDKEHLKLNQNINNFKNSAIAKSDFILGLICNEFLKSSNCMDEILKIKKIRTLESCFIPIVHHETEFYSSKDKFKRQKFWLDKMLSLQSMAEEFPLQHRSKNITNELHLISQINSEFGYFLDFVLDKKHIIWTDNRKENSNQLLELANKLNKKEIIRKEEIDWKNLEKQVGRDNLEEVLNILIEKILPPNREEVILILGRLAALDKEIRLGLKVEKTATIERNKIRHSLLNLMKILKKNEKDY